MRPYHRQIAGNVVVYIAQQYCDAHKKDITQTLMFKIVALLFYGVSSLARRWPGRTPSFVFACRKVA